MSIVYAGIFSKKNDRQKTEKSERAGYPLRRTLFSQMAGDDVICGGQRLLERLIQGIRAVNRLLRHRLAEYLTVPLMGIDRHQHGQADPQWMLGQLLRI